MKLSHAGVMDHELALAFEDGTEVFIPLALLRKKCPCAGCNDLHGTGIGPAPDLHSDWATSLSEIQIVGSYALQFIWQDGHSAGIYSYTYLQEIAEDVP